MENRSPFTAKMGATRRLLSLLLLCATLHTPSALHIPVGSSSRRAWCQKVASTFVGTAVATSLAEQTLAVELLYKKQEVLQGKIFRKERAEKASELVSTFVDARKQAGEFEAGLEFGGTVNQVRLGLRAKPFQGIRKDGKEILALMEADNDAFSDNQSRTTLASASDAYKEGLASIEDADQAAMRAVREGAPVAEVASKLKALERPLSRFIKVSEGFVVTGTPVIPAAAVQRDS